MKQYKNPVMQKAYEQGKSDGYELGLSHSEALGIAKATNYIAGRFSSLNQVPGIGPKMIEKIKKHFGEEYFF
ncbi:helix-hairpin-helix domain-containing protein [Bacillus sp. RO3]|nr:helix-hairpin-helix domain-containing protein [Bacillus sp. RO3]